MKRKFIVTALLSLMLTIFIVPSAIYAADDETIVCDVNVSKTEEITPDAPDGDELFEQYCDKVFYGKDQKTDAPSPKKGRVPAADSLGTVEKGVYDLVKATAKDIADGNKDYAEVQIPFSVFGISSDRLYTAEELGLEYIVDSNNRLNPGIRNALKEKFFNFDKDKVLYALYADCPYEFYWQHGTFSFSYPISNENMAFFDDCLMIRSGYYSVRMTVDKEFRASGGDEFSVDTGKTSAALTAVNNAKSIVQDAKTKTDYNKLVEYKNQICDRVAYDDSADSSLDGGPWAMIYVFDNDTGTNARCEGYMEAFQYLCDLTEFNNSSIGSISVRGELNGGPHGWNVVHMNDGKNYIADITNSDTGAVGADGELFLKGMTATSGGYKKVIYGHTVAYEYNSYTKSLFSDSDLNVSSADYIYEENHAYGQWIDLVPATCTEKGSHKKVCSRCGDIAVEEVPPKEHLWSQWTNFSDTQHKRICQRDVSHVEKANHNWSNGTVKRSPTCTEPGVRTYYCTDCITATRTESIPALNHDWGAWTFADKNQHQRVCTRNPSHVDTAAHSWDNGVVTKEPTCTTAGVRTFTCKDCKGTTTENIAPLTHKWRAPVYKWTSDHASVTATRTCANDTKHMETEMVKTTFVVTKPATYTAMGQTTYTARFKNGAFAAQKKTVTNIPKKSKKAQPMTVKAVAKTVSEKTLKNKKLTVAPITVKKAKGIVTYKVTGGASKAKKALSLNIKTGKITVKKLTKKGTYIIKVRVNAAGTTVYKAGNKTVTVTVKVN